MTEFNVMLAHKRNNKINVKQGVYLQPKLDGVRCYTRLIDGEVRMFSRHHKEFHNCEHIKEELKPILLENPNLILDGELYNHALKHDFNKIISLVRKQKPTDNDRLEAADLMQYHIYDLFDGLNPLMDFTQRSFVLFARFFYGKVHDSICPVTTVLVHSEEMVDSFEETVLEDGYEGAMMRLDTDYQQKRSNSLQKVKRFQDDEFEVVDAVEGKGKLKGKLGKFMMKMKDGRTFGAPASAFKHLEREEMWNNRNRFIGTKWTVEFFELTPAGIPRFPVLKGQRNYE